MPEIVGIYPNFFKIIQFVEIEIKEHAMILLILI